MGARQRHRSIAFMHLALLQAAMVLAAAGGTAAADPEESARDLLKRVFEAAPRVPFVAEVKLTTPGGFVRELALSHRRIDDSDVTFMEVTDPANLKGTRFLLFERTEGVDELFVFAPALNRVVPVHEESRKQPFLGSDFYVSDLVLPNLDTYTHERASEELVGARRCVLVASVPKSLEGALYGKIVLAIDPADLLVAKMDFFDPKGQLLKVWTLEKVEKIDGFLTPTAHSMKNVQDDTESRIELRSVEYNADIPDETFSRVHLKQ